MSLRRPPTRIELKAEDIEEYNEILRERQMAAEEGSGSNGVAKKVVGGGATTPTPNTKRKMSAAERIGIGKPR